MVLNLPVVGSDSWCRQKRRILFRRCTPAIYENRRSFLRCYYVLCRHRDVTILTPYYITVTFKQMAKRGLTGGTAGLLQTGCVKGPGFKKVQPVLKVISVRLFICFCFSLLSSLGTQFGGQPVGRLPLWRGRPWAGLATELWRGRSATPAGFSHEQGRGRAGKTKQPIPGWHS